MKISFKHQANQIKNGDNFFVTKHDLNDEAIDFAIVKMAGRYPAEKYATNKQCKEIVYVNNGSGKLVINGQEHFINAGDLILIEAGEKFYWEGNMELFASCNPAWTKEQHEIVD